MNNVLELQKLAHEMDGKGQEVEMTPTVTMTTITLASTASSIC